MGRIVLVPPEAIERARELRAAGASWGAVGRAVGFDRDVIRWRVDLEWVARRGGRGDAESMARYTYKTSEAELIRLKASIPRDTRSFTSRVMGDPLPGRSALDLLRAYPQQKKCSHNVHVLVDGESLRSHIEDRHSKSEAVD